MLEFCFIISSMKKENSPSPSSFRYLTVFYLVLFLYCGILAFLAYPKVKEYLQEVNLAQHYELWKTKESSLQESNVPVVLNSFAGNTTVERVVAVSKKDQLHYVTEALLLPLSGEELKAGYISLIPPGTKLLGIAQADGYFFVRLSEEFLSSEDLEGALLQIKETLNLYEDVESLTVICGEGEKEVRLTK